MIESEAKKIHIKKKRTISKNCIMIIKGNMQLTQPVKPATEHSWSLLPTSSRRV